MEYTWLSILETIPAGIAFIWGAAVGSFLNVVIYRLPLRKSLVHPGSFCPECGHALGMVDNIPIVSYLRLGGACRHCQDPISPRYMIVELLNAILWAAIAFKFGITVEAMSYMLIGSAFLAALFIDFERYIIPDELNNFALGLGIFVDLVQHFDRQPGHEFVFGWVPRSIAAAFVCAGIFVFIQVLGLLLFKKEAMGDGDVKLARAIGAAAALSVAISSFVIAIALGAVIGGGLLVYQAMKEGDRAAAGEEDPAPTPTPTPAPAPASDPVPYQADTPSPYAEAAPELFSESSPTHEMHEVQEQEQSDSEAREQTMVATPEEEYQPPTLGQAALIGVIYLCFIDVLLFLLASLGIKAVQPAAKMMGWRDETPLEEDDWQPTATTIPFGPYMVVGFYLALFWGEGLIAWYLRFSGLNQGP